MIYTISLNPALDYDVYLDSEITSNGINHAQNSSFRAAGKGITVSRMLKNLGLPSVCLGFAGGFAGKFISDELNRFGIHSNIIETAEATRINVKINANGTEHEITGVPPCINNDEYERFLSSLDVIKPDDYVFFSGSVSSGLPSNVYKIISQRLPKGVKTILDTRGNLLLENLDENFLVKPNLGELSEAFSAEIPNKPEPIAEYAGKLIKAGAKNVIVSMGSDGAVFINGIERIFISAHHGEVINTMGAGDSCAAGFVYAKINGMNDLQAFKTAVACGSATAFSTEVGSKESVERLLDINGVVCYNLR